MPQSNWDKKHHADLVRKIYTRIEVLIPKGGVIDSILPEIRESVKKRTGESLSQYVAEAFRRRLVKDGFLLESDKD